MMLPDSTIHQIQYLNSANPPRATPNQSMVQVHSKKEQHTAPKSKLTKTNNKNHQNVPLPNRTNKLRRAILTLSQNPMIPVSSPSPTATHMKTKIVMSHATHRLVPIQAEL